MEETWRPVPEWEDSYQVSDAGRVRSVDRAVVHRDGSTHFWRGRVLVQTVASSGYASVKLSRCGKPVTALVHHLVAAAFLGPRPSGCDVCHGPAGRADNSLPNLRYDSRAENNRDQVRHGTHYESNQTRDAAGHPFDLLVKEGDGYRRRCSICKAARQARYAARKRAGLIGEEVVRGGTQ